MEPVNVKHEADSIQEFHRYKTIARMNDMVFTLVRARNRVLEFHSHPDSDEAFFVMEGEMTLEFRDGMVALKAGDLFVVPKGTEHRPVCDADVTAMLIEKEGTLTQENTGGTYAE